MKYKAAAIFSFVVGISMILMWMMFYFTGSIPELESEQARIAMHLLAEFATALALIIAGWGLLQAKAWAVNVYLLATGALLYTLIQSPGYFVQTGEPVFVLMFAVLIILASFFLVQVLKQKTLT